MSELDAPLMLKNIDITGGGMNIHLEPHPVLKIIACQMAAMLDKAKAENFVTMEMVLQLNDGTPDGTYEMTIRRADGETPAQQLGELRDTNHELGLRCIQLQTELDQALSALAVAGARHRGE